MSLEANFLRVLCRWSSHLNLDWPIGLHIQAVKFEPVLTHSIAEDLLFPLHCERPFVPVPNLTIQKSAAKYLWAE